MAINQISTANTFQQWLTSSQSLISFANDLTDGGNSFTFFANTNVQIGGNLTVSGNIILDAISFDDINSNGSASFANNLTVLGNTTLTNIAVSGTANISTLTSTSGLLTSSTNILVNGFAFSSNANVRTGVTTFAVTNSGSGAYVFDQYSGNNPDIYLHPGQTVSFNINAAGHPFLIRQTNGGTLYNVGLIHVSTTGVVTTESGAQAKETGTLIWKVPFALTGNTYVYQCQNHAGMVGNLIIQPTVTAAFATNLTQNNSITVALNTANAAFLVANTAAASLGDGLAFAIALG